MARPDLPADGTGAMFDAIACRYDLLNRVMTAGVDRRWRRRAVRALGLGRGQRVLDVATGTGDLALEIAQSCNGARVIGLDPSRRMLDIAARKAAIAGLSARIQLIAGIAEALPFADGELDAACIGFGIRNASDRGRALREMARVVRPGGRIAVLELSAPDSAPARLWVRAVVPRLGALLSGARAYRYLARSVAAFPSPERFARMMEEAGIAGVRAARLAFGACHLYVGRAP